MSLTVSVLAASGCGEQPDHVPVRLVGFAEDDAAWILRELAAWMEARGRKVCEPQGSAVDGLRVEQGVAGVVIDFWIHGLKRSRVLATDTEAGLLRYETARAAEELVRATWEDPPEREWLVYAFAQGQWLAQAPLPGAGLGAAYSIHERWQVGVAARFDVLLPQSLADGARLDALRGAGQLWLQWTALKFSVFRLGVRLAGEAGAFSATVSGGLLGPTRGTSSWLWAGGGLSAGLWWARVAVAVLAEAGYAFTGPVVLREGFVDRSMRGFAPQISLCAGWRL